ncbi:hypothetical protein M8A51_11370 [Schlegelella sp. S2-27]|uniref:HPt domain-containing protein n=1 Tax=Caldimonas mangrovi TaxID=2944811 RepID=A0ABT0YQM0_9BURK|nr:hypothetical protein [Caldimonas mangrovi]MCM5680133.1 hypothetical protein [Caldimonas mangrovi]
MNVDTEVYARISEIEGMVEVARAACDEPGIPPPVADGVQRLTECAHRLRSVHLLGGGNAQLSRTLDELERISRDALELAGNDPLAQHAMAATLEDAHAEIRDLHRQVHGA